MSKLFEKKYIKEILFCSIFFMQTMDNIFTQYGYMFQSQVKMIKNIFLVLALLVMAFYIKKSITSYKQLKFFREICYFSLAVFIIAIISIIFATLQHKFDIITIKALIKLMFPIIVAFILVNFYSIDELRLSMKISFVIIFVGYLIFDIGFRGLTLNDITSISFVESYSPFESHYFSPQAMAFCCFFMYFRENRWITFFSCVFVFMTYKRLMIVAMLILFVIPKIFNSDYKVKKYINIAIILIFVISSYVLLNMLKLGDINILGISLDQLTMGRSYFYRLLMETGYTSYGLNTSVIALGRDLEMDLIKLLLEVGIFGLLSYIVSIVLIGGQKLYNVLLVVFVLGNSLISHFFDITYFWIVFYITIYCIKNSHVTNNYSRLFSDAVYKQFDKFRHRKLTS